MKRPKQEVEKGLGKKNMKVDELGASTVVDERGPRQKRSRLA